MCGTGLGAAPAGRVGLGDTAKGHELVVVKVGQRHKQAGVIAAAQHPSYVAKLLFGISQAD